MGGDGRFDSARRAHQTQRAHSARLGFTCRTRGSNLWLAVCPLAAINRKNIRIHLILGPVTSLGKLNLVGMLNSPAFFFNVHHAWMTADTNITFFHLQTVSPICSISDVLLQGFLQCASSGQSKRAS
jgi:hypothetical protein